MDGLIAILPPVTKCISSMALVITAAVSFNLVNEQALLLIPSKILQGEVWRLVTSFLYLGSAFYHWITLIGLYYSASRQLEEHYYSTPKEYVKKLAMMYVAVMAVSLRFGVKHPGFVFMVALEYLADYRVQSRNNLLTLIPVPSALQPFQRTIMSTVLGDDKSMKHELISYGIAYSFVLCEDIYTTIRKP